MNFKFYNPCLTVGSQVSSTAEIFAIYLCASWMQTVQIAEEP